MGDGWPLISTTWGVREWSKWEGSASLAYLASTMAGTTGGSPVVVVIYLTLGLRVVVASASVGLLCDRDLLCCPPSCHRRGHFEAPPYTDNSKISVYHVREYEVFKLAHLREPVDVFLSHDWPRGIYHHGDMARLIRTKPYFQQVRVTRGRVDLLCCS